MLLRPGLLVVMGGLVLGLMLAMYLPVFTLVEELQRR
jgi:type II secretory pathway component PulF